MAYPNNLASAGAEDSFTPFQLFAGDTPAVVTGQGIVTSGSNLAIFTVVQEVAGKLVAWDPTVDTELPVYNDTVVGALEAHVPTQPIGIMAQPINATAGDVVGPVYFGGHFNEAALVWPASINTVALRRAAFYGTPIVISALL